MDNLSNNFINMEDDILKFWDENECFKKLKEKNANNERFKFIDGPITANNPMGIHHAWGRSLKDIFLRYKAMQGYDCKYQNGFDSQGLWVEVEVEKELGFKTKKDIEEYGLDKFTEKCKERVNRFSKIITEQSIRLGQWMDWDNSYFTNTDLNIGGIWHFLKTCYEKDAIKSEYKPMPWCPRCGTSLSEHEMTGSYKKITHKSVFFKLPLEDGRRALVWTTTPWTLSSNVSLAVNKDLDYVEAKVKSSDDILVLGKNAIDYLGDDKLEILRAFKGEELVGLKFETCFEDFEAQKGVEHKVVNWEDVDADEGTGIVHIAPGCGLEDFELGERLGLAKIMPVDDSGNFLPGFGFLTGKNSHDVADEVFENLDKQGKLYKIMPYEHSYPVCWRCKSEVIFRLVPSWYITTEKLKPALLDASSKVDWQPQSGGKRMSDWLTNMGDWNISRKRFYGMPLPFYNCECGKLTVVGSKEELIELAADKEKAKNLKELHRPYIDDIEILCPDCGKTVKRIPEIGDVWLDAGIVPFSTTGYFTDKEEWKKNFPADLVVEMHEQIRLWFYSQLFMSTVLENQAPYKKVLTHGSVVAEDGSKFSKTGFMIRFEDAVKKIGADPIRYLYASNPITNDVRFGFNLGDEARRKILSFYNIFTFYQTYASIDKPHFDNFKPDKSKLDITDLWLINMTNEFIIKAKEYMDDFKPYLLIRDFEAFVDSVSNWYIRSNRRRFWKSGDTDDKKIAYFVLFYALKSLTKIMSPIIPFMTETIWQELIRKVDEGAELSVHLSDWPEIMTGYEDDSIVNDTDFARDIIQAALRLRNEAQIKVRQPLSAMYVCAEEEQINRLENFEKIIKDELNIKELKGINDFSVLEDNYLTVNFKNAGQVLKNKVNSLKEVLSNLNKEEHQKLIDSLSKDKEISIDGFDMPLGENIFNIEKRTKENYTSCVCNDQKTVVALDTEISTELAKEGILRDIVRSCQVARKDADFDVSQRITLALISKSENLNQIVEENLEHIKSELLANEVSQNELPMADYKTKISINEESLEIQLKKDTVKI
ncbi:MAG: isoleucine--tRNA ligase [Clostridia bacterium]|nr:isoleucine--tRNA ligase [Clostridia bacterium]